MAEINKNSIYPIYFGEQYEGLESIGSNYEQVAVPSDQLVMLSQVRSSVNPVFNELKDSIKQNGLLSEISIARMTEGELKNYIAFLNPLWGSDHCCDDYLPSVDGYYYLVIAGHTRTEAINELAGEAGHPYSVPCKLYNFSSPLEIISHQLDENLHSRTSPEREAIAIVESYFYGKGIGLWSNKDEFLRAKENKFSRYALDQALVFAELPVHLRQYVVDGILSYSVGVEMGRAARVAEKYFRQRFNYSDESLQESVITWLNTLTARIIKEKKSSTNAKKYIQGSASDLLASLAEDRKKGNETLFKLDVMSASQNHKLTYQALLRDFAREPLMRRSEVLHILLAAGCSLDDSLYEEVCKNLGAYAASLPIYQQPSLLSFN